MAVTIAGLNLVRFNLSMLPRLGANLIFVGDMALGVFMFIIVLDVPDTPGFLGAAVIASFDEFLDKISTYWKQVV